MVCHRLFNLNCIVLERLKDKFLFDLLICYETLGILHNFAHLEIFLIEEKSPVTLKEKSIKYILKVSRFFF